MATTDFDMTEMMKANICNAIENQGVHLQPVFSGDSPSFMYTVGLAKRGLPDLFISGNMRPEIQAGIISQVAGYFADKGVKKGVIEGLAEDPEGNDLPCKTFLVNATQGVLDQYLHWLDWYNSELNLETNVIQIVWTDEKGLFPEDEGFNPKLYNSFFLLPELKVS